MGIRVHARTLSDGHEHGHAEEHAVGGGQMTLGPPISGSYKRNPKPTRRRGQRAIGWRWDKSAWAQSTALPSHPPVGYRVRDGSESSGGVLGGTFRNNAGGLPHRVPDL